MNHRNQFAKQRKQLADQLRSARRWGELGFMPARRLRSRSPLSSISDAGRGRKFWSKIK